MNAKIRMGGFERPGPELFEGLGKASKPTTRRGAVSSAGKELIATAIAVADGDDDCVLHHPDAARRQAADEPARIEAWDVAVEMGGGPAVMYAETALEAFRTI